MYRNIIIFILIGITSLLGILAAVGMVYNLLFVKSFIEFWIYGILLVLAIFGLTIEIMVYVILKILMNR